MHQQALVIALSYANQVLAITQRLVVKGEYLIEVRLKIQLRKIINRSNFASFLVIHQSMVWSTKKY
jgi:hypothetical protein